MSQCFLMLYTLIISTLSLQTWHTALFLCDHFTWNKRVRERIFFRIKALHFGYTQTLYISEMKTLTKLSIYFPIACDCNRQVNFLQAHKIFRRGIIPCQVEKSPSLFPSNLRTAAYLRIPQSLILYIWMLMSVDE